MIPKKVTLKNFLSFGDDEQTFDFTDDESLWVLTGPNGVGKSAVFDAITYCLFTEHRGGGRDAKNLIRHGATGFRVAFEFAFNGVDYRITRTRSSNTTPLQRVERGDASGWQAIPGVNSVAEVAAWVERTLGLRFEAFTASVLLRQGEADAIVDAKGSERLAILKRIIDVERFETLANRIGEAAKKCRIQLESLQERRSTMSEVTVEDLDSAAKELKIAEEQREAAHAASLAAGQRAEQTKEAEKLRQDLSALDIKLAEADERAGQRDRIKTAHDRLGSLQAVVPSLGKLVSAKARLTKDTDNQKATDLELASVRGEVDASTDALGTAREKARTHTEAKRQHDADARRLKDEVEREAKFLTTAEEVERLSGELQSFEPDLDDKISVKEDHFRKLEETIAMALALKAQTETRLQQTQADLAQFETVGPTCSKCRQPVSEEHAAEERAAFARSIEQYSNQFESALQHWKTASEEKASAKANLDRLRSDLRTRDTFRTKLSTHRKMLDDLGIHVDPQQLRDQLDEKRRAKQDHEQHADTETQRANSASEAAQRLEKSLQHLTIRRDALMGESQGIGVSMAADRREHETLRESLPSDWRLNAESMSTADVAELATELESLVTSGIAQKFAALQSDSELQIVGKAKRQELKSRLADLPTESVADAENALSAIRAAARDADSLRDQAQRKVDELKSAGKTFRVILNEIASAEVVYERHRKLHGWLGKDGLLRELVRDAERDIVRFAQETLKNLSGGDLEIELQNPSDGKDEALVLLVRRAGDPEVIPVKFLSGSQKFRVAVAIAVAIGKFAAGTSSARPLESVIIDEGFGSLDRDGLHAMREELENLKRSQALKRVILVSHQEEFTSTFSVGYRLTPSDTGTRATRFRHAGVA